MNPINEDGRKIHAPEDIADEGPRNRVKSLLNIKLDGTSGTPLAATIVLNNLLGKQNIIHNSSTSHKCILIPTDKLREIPFKPISKYL